MQEAAKEQMNKISNNLVKSASEMNSIMHDAVTASLQSTSVMVKGCGDLCDTMNALMQRTIEQSASMSQSMLSVTSMDDFMNKQGSVMKSSLDEMMSEVSNITQLSSKIAQDAAEPMTNHVNQTISKMSQNVNTNTSQVA